MTDMTWRDVVPLLKHPRCQGTGPIQLIAVEGFYDEEALPFRLAEGGAVLRVLPRPGFPKEALAGSADERLLIVDCPDDDGWLVPEEVVSNWMNRNVQCPDLEDALLSHPLYEYLTQPDEDGRSRGGGRGELVQWAPGSPSLASLYPPEFLPEDEEAPPINRERGTYALAVADLLERLEANFALIEIELGLRFGDDPAPWEDDDPDEGEEAMTVGGALV